MIIGDKSWISRCAATATKSFGILFLVAWAGALLAFPFVKGRPAGLSAVVVGLLLGGAICRQASISALNLWITRDPTKRFLVKIAGAAIVLRLAAICLFPVAPVNDHAFFHRYAIKLLAGDGYGGIQWPSMSHIDGGRLKAFYPPGMTFLLAGCYSITGAYPVAGKILNSIIGVGLVLLIYDVGRRAIGPITGRWAATLAAVFPTLVFYSASLGYEVALATVLLAVVDLTLLARSQSRAWVFATIGALLGIAALIKPIALLVPILLSAYSLTIYGVTQTIRFSAITVVAMVAVVAPWTFRNYRTLGAFVPVSTNGGYVLYSVNSPSATGLSRKVAPPPGEVDEASMDRSRFRAARVWIIGNPIEFGRLALLKTTYTWGTTSTIISYLSCDRLPTWQENVYMAVLNTAWTMLFVLCVRGALSGGAWHERGLLLPIWLLAYVFALHLAFEAESRHHIPVIASLILVAACGLTREKYHGPCSAFAD